MSATGGSSRPNSISSREAIVELYRRVAATVTAMDPAPWFRVSTDLIEMFADGDEVTYVRKQKLQHCCKLFLERGLLLGDLRAHFSDGLEACDIPGWAWEDAERNKRMWREGRLPVDIFLPDEWQRWSCHSVFFEKDDFSAWMEVQDLQDRSGLQVLPQPHDARYRPEPLKYRLPPENPFVTLSEALSWIAFRFSLNRDELDRAISGHAFGVFDAKLALADAMVKFATWASGGQIATRGKYVEGRSGDEAKVLTAPIDPVRFEDFAQFDILYDGLHYGTGLTWNNGGNVVEQALQDRPDSFRSVKVKRADLMRYFPGETADASSSLARAMMMLRPAILEGKGAVIGLDEASSWLAYGKASNDAFLTKNQDGKLNIYMSNGEPLVFNYGTDLNWRETNLLLHTALTSGDLPSYVAADDGKRPLVVPRYYWNQISPTYVNPVFKGVDPNDPGIGTIILVSWNEFDKWRSCQPQKAASETQTNVSTGAAESECEDWLAKVEFANDPEKRMAKSHFKMKALEKFNGRLSERGFLRVWAKVAPADGRSKAGRKS